MWRFLTWLCVGLALVASAVLVTAAQSTRDEPVPMESAASIDDFEVRVVGFDPDANEWLPGASPNNALPPVGLSYVVTTVEVTYQGNDVAQPTAIRWSYIGTGKTELQDASCTTYGDTLDDEGRTLDLFNGGSVQFEMCALVPSDQVHDLVIYGRTVTSERVFFALDPLNKAGTPSASPVAFTTPAATPG